MKILVVVIAGLIWFNTLVSGGSYQYSATHYNKVYVRAGDTVWEIAKQHIQPREDVRELVYAIREINRLDTNASVYPGQVLLIPLRK